MLFDQKAASTYDQRFASLRPIHDNLHFLIRLILQDLPQHARILCVGVGTGTEIIRLASQFPHWHFVGLDPSGPMLDVCRERLENEGLTPRCELFHGYVADLTGGNEPFDAVLCLLVTQFVTDPPARLQMFRDMARHLKPGGRLINAEISGDMDSPLFQEELVTWKAMHRETGATEEQLAGIAQTLRAHVAVVPPPTIEQLLRDSGFPLPVLFFQSLLIHAWHSQKP